MRIGFCSGSYTSKSSAIADEECINFYPETLESQGVTIQKRGYGGVGADTPRCLYGTPGTVVYATLPEQPVRAQEEINGRRFAVGGTQFCEVNADASVTVRGSIASDNGPVSIAISNIQLLIVSAGLCYCFTLADNTLIDVTAQLAGVPMQCKYSDGYFIVCFKDSNKFQMSQILDGTTWPGLLVNEVSVFPENISSIEVDHRELWVFGLQHSQPYQDTGSDEVFDVIPGALIEKGSGSTFGPCKLDNSIFWIDQDERGGRTAWRANGYVPQRVSTHAVEYALASYPSISGLVSYAYQDAGHLFWVLYIPGTDCSWVYDVAENLWSKRAQWDGVSWFPHASQNHIYSGGKHLVGDWNTANIYEMNLAYYDDAGTAIRRLRRTPIISNEMEWITFPEIIIDFDTGLGPQPPLTDGDGNERPPEAMLRWSDDRGKTWSNVHTRGCGFAGQYKARVRWLRCGRSRYRVFELSVSDPIPWAVVDAYVKAA